MIANLDQMDKMAESLIKACSDYNAMTHNAIQAGLQSATVLAKGCEEACDSMSALMQKSLENWAQANRIMANAKSIHDIMDMQANMMKGSFDGMLAEINKMTQLSSRVAQQASEPVAQHMNAAITKLSLVKAA